MPKSEPVITKSEPTSPRISALSTLPSQLSKTLGIGTPQTNSSSSSLNYSPIKTDRKTSLQEKWLAIASGTSAASMVGPASPLGSKEGSKRRSASLSTSSRLRQDILPLHSNLIVHPRGLPLTEEFAKIVFVCCSCKRWHDLPTKVFETIQRGYRPKEELDGGKGKEKGKAEPTAIEGVVRCPWCSHAMTMHCCESWAVLMNLHERLH